MASCEKCKTTGIPSEAMRTLDVEGQVILVGPCCTPVPLPLNYHLEFSSNNGLVARVEYGDLKVEYKKSQEQLRRTFSTGVANEVPPEVH